MSGAPTRRTDPVRAALDALPYGLYAIGVAAEGRTNAFTANWVTQVSSEPPLVAVAVEADAPSLALARAGGAFSITLYAAGQRRDAALLARPSGRAPKKLRDVPHSLHASGVPIIEGGVAWLVCRLVATVDAGDHALLIGHVEEAGRASSVPDARGNGAAEPLTMHRAGFHYG